MKIAICCLSQFTYVVSFLDAAEKLNQQHEICYFLGFYDSYSVKILQERNIPFQILLNPNISLNKTLKNPNCISSTFELFQDWFFKHGEICVPHLLVNLQKWQPNLIIADHRDYAGITASEILNIPFVCLMPLMSPVRVKNVDPPYGSGIIKDASKKKIEFAWQWHEKFNQKIDLLYNQKFRIPYKLSEIENISTLHSYLLTIVCSISSLNNKNTDDPDYIKFVGPLFTGYSNKENRLEKQLIKAIAKMPKPRVLITLGTMFLEDTQQCLEALANFSGTVIVSLGRQKNTNLKLSRQPKNLIIRPFFENLRAIIKLSDVIVNIASAKTVLDSLSVGKPLICLPKQGQHRETALILQKLNAGEIPCPLAWKPKQFAQITEKVIEENKYKQAAQTLETEIEKSGKAEEVIKII